ncbi:MAG: diguanylate cyclase [Pseudoxanthomonas sp.]
MTFDLVKWFSRSCCALALLCGLGACARDARPVAYVVAGQAALSEAPPQPCLHQHPPGRTRLTLAPPAGGWSGAPQAVVVLNVFRGEIEIRHGERERCGVLQDARTLDSRFLAGMGTVLVPARGDLRPIEVEFDPSPLPLWRPIVRLGEPAPVQRQDTFRFSLRVASVAVMLALVLSSLLTFISARERAFLSYGVGAMLFALWMALLSGLWAYPRPWLPLEGLSLRLLTALPMAMIGMTMRMLAHQAAPRSMAKAVRRATNWLMPATLLLAAVSMVLPETLIGPASLLDEGGFYLLCAAMTVLAMLTLWRGEHGGVTAATCVVPFLGLGLMELSAPNVLASWKVEAMMLSGCWLALTASMALTLRLGSLRRQRDEMRLLAQTDALTGLPNRRAALEHLAEVSAEARQRGSALAVGFLDIDHFKDINDQHGHDVGDQVLQLFARTLRQVFRDGDYVARMGGEEFLVVLPGVTPQRAQARIESLRTLLGQVAVELQRPGLRVTLSAGVTGLLSEDADTVALLQRADAAMYAAKRAGRDRVELAPAPTSTVPA